MGGRNDPCWPKRGEPQNKSPLKFHEIKRGAPPPYSRMIWKGGGRVAVPLIFKLMRYNFHYLAL